MIWCISAGADLAGTKPDCPPAEAYTLFDGLFQQALLRCRSATTGALDDFRRGVRDLFPRLVG